jgi:hypothetical protein
MMPSNTPMKHERNFVGAFGILSSRLEIPVIGSRDIFDLPAKKESQPIFQK